MTTSATYSFGAPPQAGRGGRTVFHRLRVSAVEPLADGAVTLTVAVPPHLVPEYRFVAGQHLTFRADVDGRPVRRSYSICDRAPEADGPRSLRVAVKHLPGGLFSGFVHGQLRPGDEIDVMTPLGHFAVVPERGAARRHVAIAAGSGITPVLSIVSTVLRDEPGSSVTLLYGNRRTSSVMFLEELADLKDRYRERFQLVHVLSREPLGSDLLSGRLDPPRVEALLDALVGGADVDHWHLCGPFEMVTGVRELLTRRGVAAARVHAELFHVEDSPPVSRTPEEEERDAAEADVVVNLNGRTSTVRMRSRAQNILAATLQVRPEAPFSCTNGVCGTCRARVVEGKVRMDRNYALERDDIARGVVLACQAHPTTDRVVLDYDT